MVSGKVLHELFQSGRACGTKAVSVCNIFHALVERTIGGKNLYGETERSGILHRGDDHVEVLRGKSRAALIHLDFLFSCFVI